MNKKEQQNSLNEIRFLASINQPNITKFYEAFFHAESQCLFMVMEYLDGGDLFQHINYLRRKSQYMDEQVVWIYLIQLIQGLKALHAMNICHRDIKSANIFLCKDGITAKIGDLNVSKITRQGMCHTQTGTPYYASPEVWRDQPYDLQADVWSLGCIAYEMCMHKTPFRAQGMDNLYKQVQTGEYAKLNTSYSEELANLIDLMLITNPKKRPTIFELFQHDSIQKRLQFLEDAKMLLLQESEGQQNNSSTNFQFCRKDNQEAEDDLFLMQSIYMPKKLSDLPSILPEANYQNANPKQIYNNNNNQQQKIKNKQIQEEQQNNNKTKKIFLRQLSNKQLHNCESNKRTSRCQSVIEDLRSSKLNQKNSLENLLKKQTEQSINSQNQSESNNKQSQETTRNQTPIQTNKGGYQVLIKQSQRNKHSVSVDEAIVYKQDNTIIINNVGNENIIIKRDSSQNQKQSPTQLQQSNNNSIHNSPIKKVSQYPQQIKIIQSITGRKISKTSQGHILNSIGNSDSEGNTENLYQFNNCNISNNNILINNSNLNDSSTMNHRMRRPIHNRSNSTNKQYSYLNGSQYLSQVQVQKERNQKSAAKHKRSLSHQPSDQLQYNKVKGALRVLPHIGSTKKSVQDIYVGNINKNNSNGKGSKNEIRHHSVNISNGNISIKKLQNLNNVSQVQNYNGISYNNNNNISTNENNGNPNVNDSIIIQNSIQVSKQPQTLFNPTKAKIQSNNTSNLNSNRQSKIQIHNSNYSIEAKYQTLKSKSKGRSKDRVSTDKSITALNKNTNNSISLNKSIIGNTKGINKFNIIQKDIKPDRGGYRSNLVMKTEGPYQNKKF